MTNAMLGVFVAMSGLLSANMPDILDYINYISPIPYITRLLTINEFDASVTFSCTPEEVSTGRCIYPNGEEVLRKLSSSNSFSYDQFGYFIGIAASLAVIYRATAFVVLKIKAG